MVRPLVSRCSCWTSSSPSPRTIWPQGGYIACPLSYWIVFTHSLSIPRRNVISRKSIWGFLLQHKGSFRIPVPSTHFCLLKWWERWGRCPLAKSRVSTEHCFRQKHGEYLVYLPLLRWCVYLKNLSSHYFCSMPCYGLPGGKAQSKNGGPRLCSKKIMNKGSGYVSRPP